MLPVLTSSVANNDSPRQPKSVCLPQPGFQASIIHGQDGPDTSLAEPSLLMW